METAVYVLIFVCLVLVVSPVLIIVWISVFDMFLPHRSTFNEAPSERFTPMDAEGLDIHDCPSSKKPIFPWRAPTLIPVAEKKVDEASPIPKS